MSTTPANYNSVETLAKQAHNLEASDSRAALALYDRVIKTGEGASWVYINAGTLYYNIKNYKKAKTYYLAAIKLDPNYALAYYDLGNALEELEDYQRSIDAYQKAINLEPTYADAHFNLARAYDLRLNQPNKAIPHYKKYIKFDKISVWTDIANKRIREIAQKTLSQIWDNTAPIRTKKRAKLKLVKLI